MIKELLLKHRMQERQAAANAVASLNSRLPSVTSVTAVSSGETPPVQNPHLVTKKPLLSTVATARPTEVKVSKFFNNYFVNFFQVRLYFLDTSYFETYILFTNSDLNKSRGSLINHFVLYFNTSRFSRSIIS